MALTKTPTGESSHARASRTPPVAKSSSAAASAAAGLLGRAEQLVELARLSEAERLVVLTGPPGIGKTRLALALAERAGRGGTCVVELAAVTRPVHVARAVASALSVDEQPGQSVTDTIVARIGKRRRLVVLDNCEHLLGGCAELVGALLAGCPQLRIVATSREALGVDGERVWEVPALAVPEADKETPEALASFAAVQLFVGRAARAQPGFALNAYVGPAVAEVCRRLDGVPLAIELAAVRVESLTPQEIALRLNDRFGLLTTGPDDAVARHQTLQAALDWSHDLLTEPEQTLLRRLSVFLGGCEIEAAEAVCGDGLGAGQLEGVLAALVSKSLVAGGGEGGRFGLLETIRAYATERLEEAGETASLRAAHARFFVSLAERAESELTGPHQQDWFERLEDERANLRAAIEWSLGHGETEQALRLAGALVLFWRVRCHFSEGRELLDAAISAGEAAPPELRAKALWGAGFMALMVGEVQVAVLALERSIALCDRTGDGQLRGRALLVLADCGQYREDLDTLELLNASAALARRAEDSWGLSHALGMAGFENGSLGRLATARSLFEECLAVAREANDQQSLCYGLIGLGWVCLRQGDFATAQPRLEEALAATAELGEDYGTATVLRYLGKLAIDRGEHDRAHALLEEALAVMPADPPEATFGVVLQLAELALHRDDRNRARLLLDRLDGIAAAGAAMQVSVLRGRAELAIRAGDLASARRLLEEALACASGGDGETVAGVLYSMGGLARIEGDVQRASALHHEALEIRSEIGEAPSIVASLEAMAGLDPAAGCYEPAARLLGAAQALRDANGYARRREEAARNEADVALVREALGKRRFAVVFEQGAMLSIDDAIAYALGHRGRRGRPSAGWSSLTRREQDVAQLAAGGLSNAEIAERLSITPATVKYHLSNVFRKLELSGRTELAGNLMTLQNGLPAGREALDAPPEQA